MKLVNFYGCPGAGKSTRILTLARDMLSVGLATDSIAIVTYTRAGGDEIKLRLARSMGIPFDGSTNITRVFPWVGTIHSIAFRFLGLETSRVADPNDFIKETRGGGWSDSTRLDDLDVSEHISDTDLMLSALSLANHRMCSLGDAIRSLPVDRVQKAGGPDRLIVLAQKYDAWKNERGLYDYDDMLLMALKGGVRPLPVRVIIVDEAQDNSALMWALIDRWAEGKHALISAGDFYQAIYEFAGASPTLFRNRPGEWRKIGDSHRLPAAAADFARAIVRPIQTEHRDVYDWVGLGGQPVDGTSFVLARTGALLGPARKTLLDNGTPFVEVRGRGTWDAKSSIAWRTAYRFLRGESISLRDLKAIIDTVPNFPDRRRMQLRLKAAIDSGDRTPVDLADLRPLLGQADPEGWMRGQQNRLSHSDYFERVLAAHGDLAIRERPKMAVGTIHSAKGKEADEVVLIRSWGVHPSRSLITGGAAARTAEACVAYVGATRHRTRLRFMEGTYGNPYPFPPGASLVG